MRKLMLVGLMCLACGSAWAEPEIKGVASELTGYLTSLPKTVVVNGEAEVRVPARRAVLSLRVVTESRSLQDALRSNLDLRGRIADHLAKQGMPAERIQSSKLSSTPQYGIFGDKARSYRVENVMRVAVQDEKEFQQAAGTVDMWSEVQFGSIEFEYADQDSLKVRAIGEACENANRRKAVFEEKLGLKLVATKFSEGDVVQKGTAAGDYRSRGSSGSSSLIRESPSYAAAPGVEGGGSSFGELVYAAKVTVEYRVQPAEP